MQFKGSKVTRRSIRLWQPLSGKSMPCGICWLWRWMHSDCLNPAIGRFRPALGADGSDRTVHNTGQSSVVDMNAATGSLSRWSRLAARPQQVAVDWSRRPPSRTKCDEPHLSLKRHPVQRRFAPVRPFKDRECCPPPPPPPTLHCDTLVCGCHWLLLVSIRRPDCLDAGGVRMPPIKLHAGSSCFTTPDLCLIVIDTVAWLSTSILLSPQVAHTHNISVRNWNRILSSYCMFTPIPHIRVFLFYNKTTRHVELCGRVTLPFCQL